MSCMGGYMNLELLKTIFFTGVQIIVVLFFSPLINTFMKKVKACFQGRKGPPLMQGYYDLIKYFQKEVVISKEVSWLFLISPYIVFALTLLSSLLVPTFIPLAQLSMLGGIVLLVYLLGLSRFFMASSSMEPGSGFCGMASSREMMLATLIEPVMLLSLFVLALLAGTTNIPDMINNLSKGNHSLISPSYILAIVALITAAVAEMGRVPFDNPETHYELTMIHEGMLLEYSGKYLGLMFWSSWIKQFIVLSLVTNLIWPIEIPLVFNFSAVMTLTSTYFIKLTIVCIFVVIVETLIAKVRLFRVKELLVTSFVISVIALVFSVQKNIGILNP